MENPNEPKYSGPPPSEEHLAEPARKSSRRWLGRLFIMVAWFALYAVLPNPFDELLMIGTALAVSIWLYNRVCGRIGLHPVNLTVERVERITLTHDLLGLILVVMTVGYSELVKLNTNTEDVHGAVTDAHESASSDADEIRSALDDLKDAIESR